MNIIDKLKWGLYRQAVGLAKENPTDMSIRTAVVAYWTGFERAASRFGMSPCDRARLRGLGDERPRQPEPGFRSKIVG